MKKLLSWMLVLTMSFSFMSCSKNDNNDPQGGEVESLNTVLLPYPIEVQVDNYPYTSYCGVEVHKDVLKCYCNTLYEYAVQQICIGKVNKLSDIKSVPATGWQTDDLPVQEGYGYLVRVRVNNQWLYKRLYIKEFFVIGGDDWYCKMDADFGDCLFCGSSVHDC